MTAKNLKVFFSRITLEDKLGVQYEPYIYAALSSARVMLAIGTDFDYYDAVWVKNEWGRFLAMMKEDKGKSLIPCFKGIDAYDIPKEFKGLQAQDMSKLGWLQDLTRGVEKLCGKLGTQAAAAAQQTTSSATSIIEPLLKRAQLFLEDSNWKEADAYCEKVLDLSPENVQAYLYKLMAELNVSRAEELKNCPSPFKDKNSYQKIMRFGDAGLQEKLKSDVQFIKERNENARLTKAYEDAREVMNSARTIKKYESAAKALKRLGGFKDSASLEQQCMDKIAQIKKDIEEALKLADVIIATEESKLDDSVQVLNEQLEKLRNNNSQLSAATAECDDLQTKKDAAERELRTLRNTRENLGLFAGKEKKATDARIDKCREELRVLNSRISACQRTIHGLPSQKEAEERINNLEKTIAAKEAASLTGVSSLEEAEKRLYELCELNPEITQQMWRLKIYFAKEGDSITFGTYPSVSKEQKTPIEWQVLKVEGKKKLVISKYAIECLPYNKNLVDITWESSTLRKWLNSDFYNAAFSGGEKKAIVQTKVTADKNPEYNTDPGNAVSDRVFLLSIAEAEKYFSDNNARMCVPTEYAKAQGAYTNDGYKVGGKATCWWWLRSPGYLQNDADDVLYNGSVDYDGISVSYEIGCVRPALWINLES